MILPRNHAPLRRWHGYRPAESLSAAHAIPAGGRSGEEVFPASCRGSIPACASASRTRPAQCAICLCGPASPASAVPFPHRWTDRAFAPVWFPAWCSKCAAGSSSRTRYQTPAAARPSPQPSWDRGVSQSKPPEVSASRQSISRPFREAGADSGKIVSCLPDPVRHRQKSSCPGYPLPARRAWRNCNNRPA